MILLLAAVWSAGAASWEPTSWEPADWPSPALGVTAAAPKPPADDTLLGRMYRWYRAQSAKDGAGCPYYPTCSGYGRIAVSEHGLVLGAMLTTDRLFREYWWMERVDDYPIVTPHGVPRLNDPVPPPRWWRE